MSKIKVALIGMGNWGRQHARVLTESDEVDFCAVVGRTQQRTAEQAKIYGTRYYLDIHEMLHKEKPDLIHICLPNQDHFETTLEVIKAGYPLFVEKPLVFDLDQAKILINEAERRKLFFGINFNHRYAKPIQLAKQAIQEGILGDLVFASWRFGGEGFSNHPHANLIETQCHGFDTLEYLCGPIVSVIGEMTDMTNKGYSTIALSLKFSSGCVGTLLGSYDTSYAYTGAHFMEINGTEGRVKIEDTVAAYSLQKKGNETSEVWKAGYFNDYDREFHRTFDTHYAEVIRAFKAGLKPPVEATAGFRALKLSYAAIESFTLGRRVIIDSE